MASLSSVCYWGHKERKGFDKINKDFYDQTVFITRYLDKHVDVMM